MMGSFLEWRWDRSKVKDRFSITRRVIARCPSTHQTPKRSADVIAFQLCGCAQIGDDGGRTANKNEKANVSSNDFDRKQKNIHFLEPVILHKAYKFRYAFEEPAGLQVFILYMSAIAHIVVMALVKCILQLLHLTLKMLWNNSWREIAQGKINVNTCTVMMYMEITFPS